MTCESNGGGAMLHEVVDQLAVIGKAFGSGRRLELIEVLAQGERTVESLADACDMRVNSASAHLQVLKLAHLVQTRREGTRIYYRLAGDDVASLFRTMLSVAQSRSADVERALNAHMQVPGEGEVGVVSRDDLAELIDSGQLQVVDVRPREEFAAGHITGARSVPFDEVSEASFDDDAPIIVYCRGTFCVMAHDSVRLLADQGIHARRLEDGMLEWRLAGLPVSVGDPGDGSAGGTVAAGAR